MVKRRPNQQKKPQSRSNGVNQNKLPPRRRARRARNQAVAAIRDPTQALASMRRDLRTYNQRYLDECLATFIQVRADPFCRPNGPVCNPANDSGYNLTYPFYQRVQVSVGTGGVGFIGINPYILASDTKPIFYTGSTYAGTDMDTTIPLPTGVSTTGVLVPYALADIRYYKLVALGIRMQSSSPALTAKGTIYAVRLRENQSTNLVTQANVIGSVINKSHTHNTAATYQNIYQTQGGGYDDKWISQADVIASNNSSSFVLGLFISGAAITDTFVAEIQGYVSIQHQSATETTFTAADPRATQASANLSQAYSAVKDATVGAASGFVKAAADTVTTHLGNAAVGVVKQLLQDAVPMGLPNWQAIPPRVRALY